MKKYFSILFLALSFLASATPTVLFTVTHDVTVTPTTVKPNTFPDGGIPNLTEAIYSQESGTARKYTLANTQKAIGVKAATSTIAYVPTATGNPISDRNKIVKCSVNSKTYLIDVLGNAIETGASAVAVVPQNIMNSDLTANGNRVQNFSGYDLELKNIGSQLFNAINVQSFNSNGFQSLTANNRLLNADIQTISTNNSLFVSGNAVTGGADPTGKFLKCINGNGQVEYANIPAAAPTTVSNTFNASGLTTNVNGVNSTPISVVSTDANNAILQGSDNKMFVAVGASQNIMNSDLVANDDRVQDFNSHDLGLVHINNLDIQINENGVISGKDIQFSGSLGITLANEQVSNGVNVLGKYAKSSTVSGKIQWVDLPASQNLVQGTGIVFNGNVINNALPNITETATQTPFTAIASSTTQAEVTGANVQAALNSVATSLKTLESTTAPFTKGDTKLSYVSADHNGWILLNGRAISTLTATQQTAANVFFSGNIDNTNGLFLKSGANGTSGSNISSVTLNTSNIPKLIIGGSATVNTVAYSTSLTGVQSSSSIQSGGNSISGTNSLQSWNVDTTALFVGNPNAQAVSFPVNPQSKNLNHFIYLGL